MRKLPQERQNTLLNQKYLPEVWNRRPVTLQHYYVHTQYVTVQFIHEQTWTSSIICSYLDSQALRIGLFEIHKASYRVRSVYKSLFVKQTVPIV